MASQLLEKAVNDFKQGDLALAKSNCQRVLKASKKHAFPFFLLANIYRAEGQLDLAITQYKKAIALDPRQHNFYLTLGDTYQLAHKPAQALKLLVSSLRHIKDKMQRARIQFGIGLVYRAMNEPAKALEALHSSIELNPSMADPYSLMGSLHEQMGDLFAAVKCHLQAITLNPNSHDAHNNLGVLYLRDNRLNEAQETFEKLLSLSPNHSLALRNLGNTLMQLQQPKQALAAFERYLAINGPDASVSHIISALKDEQPSEVAAEYVEHLFDDFAQHFEQSLVKELGYSLPTQFVKLLQQQAVLVEGKSNTVLDLGCGTGLVGQALPGHIKQLDGVDLSQAMLDIAGEKNIYHRLCKANAVDYLITHLLPYDIIIAADVLIYFGDLRALFSAVKNNSRPGSVFIFSIESLQCENYKLLKSGRFAHNPSYIENLLDEFEFTIESKVRTIIRKEHTTSLDGFIYLGLTEIFDTTHNPYPFGKRTAACLILARF